MKYKILLQIDNLGSGGAQRQICILAENLKKIGYSVTVLVYSPGDHMKYMLDRSCVDLVVLNKLNSYKFFCSYLGFLRKEKFDVLISFLDRPNQIASIAKIFGLVDIWIPSERNICLDDDGIFEVVWRSVLYAVADKVVSNSYTQKKWLERRVSLWRSKFSVIWNGVVPEMFSDVHLNTDKLKKLNFISLGRIGKQKNPEFLLNSLKDYPLKNIKFDWYGEEDVNSIGLREILNVECNRHGLPIKFNLPVKNVSETLRNSYCLILTSLYEGLPNVVLEAMAFGVIVLVPNVSDLEVLVKDGVRGFVYESGSKDSFILKLNLLINLTQQQYIAMAESAQLYVLENCGASAMAENYERVFCEINS